MSTIPEVVFAPLPVGDSFRELMETTGAIPCVRVGPDRFVSAEDYRMLERQHLATLGRVYALEQELAELKRKS